MTYKEFLDRKTHLSCSFGFEPVFMPGCAFDFQKALIEWAVRKGRAAIFADCGLGKTLMQLAWAENVVRKTNGNVLILTPLAVGAQTVAQADQFGIEAKRSRDGQSLRGITVTNYEKLHLFNPHDFVGVACDESSIIKHATGATQKAVTRFMAKMPYRTLWTATAAPNDWMELGTSSEALGYMKHREMLSRFFTHDGGETSKWRIKGHAKNSAFWRWVCSWARACRKPSDLGFSDDKFKMPALVVNQHVVASSNPIDGFLFTMPAISLDEQRAERRVTLRERCEKVCDLVSNTRNPAVVWCHLNIEGDTLENIIDDSVQVSGCDSDESKEEKFDAFERGQIRVIISKPTVAGFGLNWQHCNHQTFFPSHSFEQWYQSIRRCWRFGQKRDVTVDVVTSEGEQRVTDNLQRKADAATQMFNELVTHMNNELQVSNTQTKHTHKEEIPTWLLNNK